MKILEIIPQLTFDGGGERFVCDLCNELTKKHQVVLLVLYQPTKYPNYKEALDPKVNIIFLNKKMGIDISLFRQIERIIKQEQPHIVHTHLRAITYLLPSILKHHKKIHFLHTIHSDAFKEAGDSVNQKIRAFLFKKRYCTPITISKNGEDSFRACYKMRANLIPNGKKAVIIPNANVQNEISALKKTAKTKLLINVARIDYPKNQILLCKAFSELIKENIDAELLIIGGLFDHEAVNQINDLDCPNLHLLGIKNNPMNYMELCDAFCLSSIYEGMPISLIEAFYVGIIPICTAVGGINDMIQDGSNGFLSPDLTVESYKKTLLRFFNLSDKEQAEIKQKSKESFSKYTIENCANSYLNLMHKKNG